MSIVNVLHAIGVVSIWVIRNSMPTTRNSLHQVKRTQLGLLKACKGYNRNHCYGSVEYLGKLERGTLSTLKKKVKHDEISVTGYGKEDVV